MTPGIEPTGGKARRGAPCLLAVSVSAMLLCLAPATQAQTHTHTHGEQAGSATLAAMAASSAVLVDEVREYRVEGKPHQRWQTFWVLDWVAFEGASRYEIVYKTSEGTSRKVTQVDKPPFRLEVAKGDHPKARDLLARGTQLTTIKGLLSVRVRAHSADGTGLSETPWMQVGAPLATR